MYTTIETSGLIIHNSQDSSFEVRPDPTPPTFLADVTYGNNNPINAIPDIQLNHSISESPTFLANVKSGYKKPINAIPDIQLKHSISEPLSNIPIIDKSNIQQEELLIQLVDFSKKVSDGLSTHNVTLVEP